MVWLETYQMTAWLPRSYPGQNKLPSSKPKFRPRYFLPPAWALLSGLGSFVGIKDAIFLKPGLQPLVRQ